MTKWTLGDTNCQGHPASKCQTRDLLLGLTPQPKTTRGSVCPNLKPGRAQAQHLSFLCLELTQPPDILAGSGELPWGHSRAMTASFMEQSVGHRRQCPQKPANKAAIGPPRLLGDWAAGPSKPLMPVMGSGGQPGAGRPPLVSTSQ